MSAPSLKPDQPSSGQYRPGQNSSGHNSFQEMAKLAKWVGVVCGMLATLILGIVIGNSARKRLDRMSHGIQ
jgi:hypothetical protein